MALQMLYVFMPSVVAGMIQATTGFGAGIFMMLFFPMFLPMIQCSALSGAVGLISNVKLTVQYRRHAHPKLLLLPACFYVVCNTLCIWYSTRIDLGAFKPYFGLFLLALGLYFLFFANRIRLKGGVLSAGACASLSGAAAGFFGIGGPPMVLYFLALVGDDKYAYLGTIQMFFLITGLQGVATRAIAGIYSLSLLALIPAGMAGIIIGNVVGTRIVQKLRVDRLRLLIYVFLCLAGLVTFVTNL